MLFSYEISLSQNLYCHDLGTFVWIKKMCKNCISEEKITNMRSAPFLAMPVFLPTPRRFFNETKFFHIDTEILICLSFKHQHQLSISINISISISASISSSAHLLIVSISISVSSSSSAHLLICSSAHLLVCLSAHLCIISISISICISSSAILLICSVFVTRFISITRITRSNRSIIFTR